jgi:ABC-type sugar transport system permease subunit
MTPALFLFAFFVFIPIFFAVYFSFTDWNGISPLWRPVGPAV